MNSRTLLAVSAVVIVLLAGTFLAVMQLGLTAGDSSTTVRTGGSYVNAPQNLQLRLSLNASSTGGRDGNVTISISVDEYNTLATANNVSKASGWALQGLSLGTCGTEAYPFGVALYSGTYTEANASQGTPLRIYPVVACPMMIRLVTGYVFQPESDLAVVLPSGPNATATPMSANVVATTEYAVGPAQSSASPLRPGTYTVAAGDEWGSVVVTHVTVGVGGGGGATSSTSGGAGNGTLEASFSVGPTQPVCRANATTGPAPNSYSSIEAVVTAPGSGQAANFPIHWISTGCEVSGSFQASLAPGSYSLSLSSCTFMGCSSALPRSLVIAAGQSTSIDVSIDTGIR